MHAPNLKTTLQASGCIALLWLLFALALTWNQPPPAPGVHDEFSYLLQADTFAHGRLSNPPHPLGVFFESPHVLIQPTYASKYQPGQAVWLALGQALFSSPAAGVLMQIATLLFVLCAMLCVWTTPRWAVTVAIVTGIWLLPPNYWTVSYWGGGATALGAATFLLGIGLYFRAASSFAAGLLTGLGALQLFLTRPFEGAVMCFFTIAGVIWLSRDNLRRMTRPALIALAVLVAGIASSGLYNKAVTGQATFPPYLLHDRTYNTAPPFWALPLRSGLTYNSPRLEAQHGPTGWEAYSYERLWSSRRTPLGVSIYDTAVALWPAILPFLPLALLLPAGLRSPRCRTIFAILALCFLTLLLAVWHMQHYAAPALVVMYLLAACCAEQASVAKPRLAAIVAAVSVAWGLGVWFTTWRDVKNEAPKYSHATARAELIHSLRTTPGQHLVVVRYADPKVCVSHEWVYNGADIDGQKIVFAHDRGAENARLFDYYKDRRAWLLTAACDHHQLQPITSVDN